ALTRVAESLESSCPALAAVGDSAEPSTAKAWANHLAVVGSAEASCGRLSAPVARRAAHFPRAIEGLMWSTEGWLTRSATPLRSKQFNCNDPAQSREANQQRRRGRSLLRTIGMIDRACTQQAAAPT